MTNSGNPDSWNAMLQHLQTAGLAPANPTHLTPDEAADSVRFLQSIYPTTFNADVSREPLGLHLMIKLNAQPDHYAWEWQCLHCYAQIARRVALLPGWDRLGPKLRTDRGFENQLFATFFLSVHLNIEAIESKTLGIDADIVLATGSERVPVEVKSVDQRQKFTRVFQAHSALITAVQEHSASDEAGRRIGVVNFTGVIPPDMTDRQFLATFGVLPTKPGSKKVDLGPGYYVEATFDWDPPGGLIGGVSNLWNFEAHLVSTELQGFMRMGSRSLLLAVVPLGTVSRMTTQDLAGLQGFLFNRDILGALFLEWGPSVKGFHFRRLPLIKTRHTTAAIAAMDDRLPLRWVYPY